MFRDSPLGYGSVTIAIHWVSTILILFLFALGLYMTGLDYYSDWYYKGPLLHVSVGVILFFITLFRLAWRSTNATPMALSKHSYAKNGAKFIKFLLYCVIFIVIISGYLITTAEGKDAVIFGAIKIPALLQLNAQQIDLAGSTHKFLAWATILLAVLHAGAALMHHFVIQDHTLVRMLKPVKKVKS